MSAYRALRRGTSGVCRGVDIRHPHAYHASHALWLSGERELIKKSVEYCIPQASHKRPRSTSPEPYTEPQAMDMEWIDEPMVPSNFSPLPDETPCNQVFKHPSEAPPTDATTDIPIEANVNQAGTHSRKVRTRHAIRVGLTQTHGYLKSRTVAKQIAE